MDVASTWTGERMERMVYSTWYGEFELENLKMQ